MEENTAQEQAIVDVTVSTDYETFKANWKYFVLKKPWKALIAALALFIPAACMAYVLTYLWGSIFSSPFLQLEGFFDRSQSFWFHNYIFSLLPAGYLILAVRNALNSRPSKLFKAYKAAFDIDSPRRYVFTEDFLICTCDTGPHHRSRIEVDYEHYTETRESSLSFYLFKPEGYAVILPKKYFSEDQAAALRELFTRKFGDKFKQYNKK